MECRYAEVFCPVVVRVMLVVYFFKINLKKKESVALKSVTCEQNFIFKLYLKAHIAS